MRRAIFLLLVLIAVFSGCKSPDETINCSATISFRQDIIPILTSKCAIAGCHTGTNPAGNVALDSAVAYSQLKIRGYFIAGNPVASPFYQQVVSTTQPMPPTGLLDKATTNKIYCWIQEGGLNN